MKVSSKTVKNWSRYLGLCLIMVKTYIHLPKSRGVSTNHKSSNNWNISIRSRFIQFLVISLDPTHYSTHTPTHGWGSLHRCQISNRIEIFRLGQGLFDFWWFTWPDPITHPPTQPPTCKVYLYNLYNLSLPNLCATCSSLATLRLPTVDPYSAEVPGRMCPHTVLFGDLYMCLCRC